MESPLPNPYATPAANLYGSASGGSADAVSPSTIAQLAGTKPWIRFMSVLMWIMSAFLILVSCLMIIVSATGVLKSEGNTAYNAGVLIGTAVYYCVISIVVIYPALKLWKYANSIAKLMASRSIADLDAALTEQRRYWKFSGIMTIIGICLALLGVIVFIAFVGTAALKSGMHMPPNF